MKVLDLFSGIGGFSLGLERAGMETIAFCEIEEYPRKVLAKHWPDIPIARDVTKLTYNNGALYDDGTEIYRGTIDVVTGGFPCQDISVAGKREGIGEGTRSGLWSECARLLGEIRPRYAIFENVTALLSGERGAWFQRVLFDISKVGYDAEWHCIPASELGAHHHRDRVWIIAYTNSERFKECRTFSKPDKQNKFGGGGYERGDVSNACKQRPILAEETRNNGENWKEPDDEQLERRGAVHKEPEILPDTFSIRQSEQREFKQSLFAETYKEGQTVNALPGGSPDIWKAESELGRVADGIPNRSHRLKSLGNAVVPQIPELIGKAILETQL